MGYSRSRFDGVLFLYANQWCQELQSLRFSIYVFTRSDWILLAMPPIVIIADFQTFL